MKKKPKVSTARRRAEQHPTKEQLEDNSICNLTLVFSPKSPVLPALEALRDEFLRELSANPLPENCRPPVATGPKRQKQSLRNVETLLANLLNMYGKGRSALAVSLNNSTYGDSACSAGFIDLVKLASHESRGMLILKKGFKDHLNKANSRTARVIPTQKFAALIDSALTRDGNIVSEPNYLINLRRGKDKIYVPPSKFLKQVFTEEPLKTVLMSLGWFNLVLQEYDISYTRFEDGEVYPLCPILHAVYTDDFSHGGRFYTGRGGHQALIERGGKCERSTIKINGHRTTELDYGGMHIRMLYHLSDEDYALDADPYDEVIDAIGRDPKEVFGELPEMRDDLKEMLLALINGKGSEKQVIPNARWRMFHSWRTIKNSEPRGKAEQKCKIRAQRWDSLGLTVEGAVEAFRDAHYPIRHDFSSGRGLCLQNIDAEIALHVMLLMMLPNESIPVLPVHDSFITFSEYDDELRAAMTNAYRYVMQRRTGLKRNFQIPVI